MGQLIGDIAAFALMALSFLGAITARALSAAIRDRVRTSHRDWYAALAATRRGLGFGSDDEHVRRRLTWPLLRGRLPPGPAADAELRALAGWFGLAFTAAVAGFGGFILVVALRVALSSA